jgi:indolepyruvate ferredoxin oxidoreductase alpha subunit
MSNVKLDQAGKKVLLMGNEAMARGAIEAGVELVAAYTGTPSSEVVGTLSAMAGGFDYYVEWSVNEKVAFDVAAGAALVGARVLVGMKGAGLNVAMDTLLTLVYGGVKGGMVIIVADDPDAHYSSNEQDSRFAAIAAEIPCLEPRDQQQAKDMVKAAFMLSEQLELPVMVRSVSRVSHGNGDVELGPICKREKSLGFNKHWKQPWRWNVYGPPGAVQKHKWLHEQLAKAVSLSEESPFNEYTVGEGDFGIIAAGIACSYTKEALTLLGLGNVPFLQIGFSHPLPKRKVVDLLQGVKKVFVVEEGDSFAVERTVRQIAQEEGIMVKIYGKERNCFLPPYGEINSEIVQKGIARIIGRELSADEKREALRQEIIKKVASRSSTLCAGCPHLGSYAGLKKVLNRKKGIHIINGDIGCYEQGGYGIFGSNIEITSANAHKYPVGSTYEVLDTCYVMGSSLPMAHGQHKAGYKDGKLVAVAGDSTFFHGLLPGVVNAVYNNADVTLLVLDNSWTAMTGHQPSPTSGLTAAGNPTGKMSIEKVAAGMGVPLIKVADAFNIKEVERAIEEAVDFNGFSMVILRGECRLQYLRAADKSDLTISVVDIDKCTGCKVCVSIGCPAIFIDPEYNGAQIDETLCNGCGLCGQVCPVSAIK